MTLLDGKELSRKIKEELADTVANIKKEGGKTPHLAAVLVGGYHIEKVRFVFIKNTQSIIGLPDHGLQVFLLLNVQMRPPIL